MPQTQVEPQDSRWFDARQQGYVVRIKKVGYPVRFIAKDNRDEVIAEGTVQQRLDYREFLVHPNTGFSVINVGETSMLIEWMQ